MEPRGLRSYSHRRLAIVGSLALLTALCLALLVARRVYVGSGLRFLAWNLFLAWIPFVLALAAYGRHRRGASLGGIAPLAFLWLLFFPNAPYLVTDLFHLRRELLAPLWFDVLVFGTFAWAGLLLGFVSLHLMQSIARRAFGWVASWALVLVALGLASFGIYLGRFLRWNSWDLFAEPGRLLGDVWVRVSNPVDNPKAVAYTLAFTAVLSVSYIVLYNFAHLRLGEHEAEPRAR